MVVESAVFIPCNDQNARIPYSGIAERFVCLLDQSLSERDVSQRMLGRAVPILVQHIIAGFNENVSVGKGVLAEIAGKLAVVVNLEQADPLQRSHHWKVVARIDPVGYSFQF